MTAKEYLSQAFYINQRINSKLEQALSLRELAEKVTVTLTDMPKSGSFNAHRKEDILAKLVDTEAEINADIDRLVDLKREISATIDQVPTVDHRTLLELRYVCGKTWDEIAVKMNFSVRNIHIIHSDALYKINKIIGK